MKYLGIIIDQYLNFGSHINNISTKLSRATGMLARIRHYVYSSFNLFRYIFFHTYGCQIWGQFRSNHYVRLERLQNRAIKILNFANFRDSSTPLYKASKILKLTDNIKLNNFLFVLDEINDTLPPALHDTFQLTAHSHDYSMCSTTQHKVNIPSVKTTIYELRSITFQSSHDWNFFINHFNDKFLHTKRKTFCKKVLSDFFLESY